MRTRTTAILLATIAVAAATPATASDRVFWGDFEAPITAPSQTWTSVPFDDAFCGDGSATGLGVNLTAASNHVIVYLAPGGACWENTTCYVLHLAEHFTTGYGPTDFASDSTGFLAQSGGFFDRSAAGNP